METNSHLQMLLLAKRIAKTCNASPQAVLDRFKKSVKKHDFSLTDFFLSGSDISLAAKKNILGAAHVRRAAADAGRTPRARNRDADARNRDADARNRDADARNRDADARNRDADARNGRETASGATAKQDGRPANADAEMPRAQSVAAAIRGAADVAAVLCREDKGVA